MFLRVCFRPPEVLRGKSDAFQLEAFDIMDKMGNFLVGDGCSFFHAEGEDFKRLGVLIGYGTREREKGDFTGFSRKGAGGEGACDGTSESPIDT